MLSCDCTTYEFIERHQNYNFRFETKGTIKVKADKSHLADWELNTGTSQE